MREMADVLAVVVRTEKKMRNIEALTCTEVTRKTSYGLSVVSL